MATDNGTTYAATINYVTDSSRLRIIDTATGIVQRNIDVGLGNGTVLIDHRRHHVLVLDDGVQHDVQDHRNRTLSILDEGSGTLLHSLDLGYHPEASIQAAEDEVHARLYVVHEGATASTPTPGGVVIVSTQTGAIVRTVPVALGPGPVMVDERLGRALVVSHNQWTFTAGPRNVRLTLLDAVTGAIVATDAVTMTGIEAPAVVLDQQHDHFLVATDDGVSMFDALSGALLRTLPITDATLTLDESANTLVALGSTSLRLADLDTGSIRATLPLSRDILMTDAADSATGRIGLLSAEPFASASGEITRWTLRLVDGQMKQPPLTFDLGVDRWDGLGSQLLNAPLQHRLFALGGGWLWTLDTVNERLVQRQPTCWTTTVYTPVVLDGQHGRLYVICPDTYDKYGTPVSGPGTVDVFDVITGTRMTTLHLAQLGPPQHEGAPILDQAGGYVIIPGDQTLSIVGPLAHTPADPVTSAPAGTQYFPRTHHTMRGLFLAFWHHYGGQDTFGDALTEAFAENECTVQYTSRFVLTQCGGIVHTVPVNDVLAIPHTFAPLALEPSSPTRRYFLQTGHTLSSRFLSYWTSHHGSVLLGAPISEPFRESNGDGSGGRYLLQWFERGRLEYHPEFAPTRYEMELGLVGLQALHDRGWVSS